VLSVCAFKPLQLTLHTTLVILSTDVSTAAMQSRASLLTTALHIVHITGHILILTLLLLISTLTVSIQYMYLIARFKCTNYALRSMQDIILSVYLLCPYQKLYCLLAVRLPVQETQHRFVSPACMNTCAYTQIHHSSSSSEAACVSDMQ
jgi:hypothetical protein